MDNKLSVVIITLNEEQNIGRCLDSVMEIADDIVVMDSFSKDATAAICQSKGVRLFQEKWLGYSETKNLANSLALYDWIFSIDADETLSDELKQSILRAKQQAYNPVRRICRITNYCGKWIRHTSWYPARKLRLWDRSKGRWGGLNPHDKFKLDKGATRKFLKGDLLHYSYYTINEHIAQINSFSTIVANAYFKENRSASYFNIVLNPVWRLFRDYIIKLGFLDGFYGLVVSVNSSHETFLKYIKLRDLIREKRFNECNKICFFNSAISWGGGEKWHYDVSNHLFMKNYETLVVTNSQSELHKRLSETTIPHYEFSISNLSFLNPFKIIRLSRLFRRENIGTIIINLSSDLKAAGIAAKLAGVKNIIYRRGSAIAIRNTILNRFLFNKVVTQVIANSEETSRTILLKNKNLIGEDRIKVIYNGIELSKYQTQQFEEVYKRVDGEVIIGNAGRLSEEKGQIYLLQLARIFKEKGYKFKILIAGTGKLKSRLIKSAKQLQVEDVVQFLGFVENIRRFNQTIDIFVLTSLYEGFGYVLVEAMAESKPVVAFDIRSSAEIVRNNISGFLVESLNVNALAEKVEELMKNKGLRIKMGESGRKIVEEVFTFDQTLSQVENLIQSEIKRNIISRP